MPMIELNTRTETVVPPRSKFLFRKNRDAECRHRKEKRQMKCFASLLLLALTTPPLLAQDKSPQHAYRGVYAGFIENIGSRRVSDAAQNNASSGKRSVTLAEAVRIFLQQNLDIVAARFDVETADAEKLTARLRPNPEFDAGFDDLPLNFSGPFFKEQEITYGISQTFELGGKRRKRMDAANANAELARAE